MHYSINCILAFCLKKSNKRKSRSDHNFMILLRLCGWGLMTGAFGKLRKLTRSQNLSLLNELESFAVKKKKSVLFGAASHLPPLCLIIETQQMDKSLKFYGGTCVKRKLL